MSSINSTAANIGPQTLTIVISGLKNPSTASATGSLTARTYYKSTDASLVASGSITGITATAALIDNSLISISASSYVVNDVGVAYTFKYNISFPILAGGYFTLLIPQ